MHDLNKKCDEIILELLKTCQDLDICEDKAFKLCKIVCNVINDYNMAFLGYTQYVSMSIEDIRLIVLNLQFDLEATRRERDEALKKLGE